jgi:hypothetical protein
VRPVIERKILVFELHRTADAFRLTYVSRRFHRPGSDANTHNGLTILVDFTGELEVHTAEDRALLAVDLHRAGNLVDDIDKMAGLKRWVGLGGFGATEINDISARSARSAGMISLSVLRGVSASGACDQRIGGTLTMASHCHTTTWFVALTASIWPGRNLST